MRSIVSLQLKILMLVMFSIICSGQPLRVDPCSKPHPPAHCNTAPIETDWLVILAIIVGVTCTQYKLPRILMVIKRFVSIHMIYATLANMNTKYFGGFNKWLKENSGNLF